MTNLLIATRNKGKVAEIRDLLEDTDFNLLSLNDLYSIPEVPETGKTFADNSLLKATQYAKMTKCMSLADDSGLEVYALDNKPGVFSARYAGKNVDDEKNTEKLLFKLNQLNPENRGARFVCAMCLSDAEGNILFTAEEECKGEIAVKSIGSSGFGYDPVFIPEGFDKTFGELPPEIKQNVSHRSKALKKIIDFLRDFDLS